MSKFSLVVLAVDSLNYAVTQNFCNQVLNICLNYILAEVSGPEKNKDLKFINKMKLSNKTK